MSIAKAGPRNAETDDRGIRHYVWQGVEYPSVTSLRRLVGVPFPLANWMNEQIISKAIIHTSNLDSMKALEGDDAAKKWLRKESTSERDDAANRGTALHAMAAERMAPEAVDPAYSPALMQFYDFLAYTGAEEVMSERQVFNLTLGYAGSLDAIYRFPRSCPFPNLRMRSLVTDLKTGKGVYADHALQIMAYAMGEFVGQDDQVDALASAQLMAAQGLAILHLSDTEWELIEIQVTPKLFEVFKAMCVFAHWQEATPSIEGLVKGRYTK